MSTRIKLHTVLLISLAFVFRLLVVNISTFTFCKSSQNNKRTSLHASQVQKRKRNSETVVKTSFEIYSDVEVCEEDSDNEENPTKVHVPALLSFHPFLFNNAVYVPGSEHSFGFISTHLYPKKCVAFSILRI